MKLIRDGSKVMVQLNKELSRSIKQGHAWLYSDAVDGPSAPTGSIARLLDRKGDIIACGIYCPKHPITLRVCRTQAPYELDDDWLIQRMESAIRLRASLFDHQTTGYRLIAGEGDGLPGLIADRYDRTVVIKLDGGAPEAFYRLPEIAQWLADRLGLETVIQRPRGRGTIGVSLVGSLPTGPIAFLENGLRFSADVISGQKTGFFLDQRDNRCLARTVSKGLSVLNLFSFSGGFSIAAGVGGASSVTSVDISPQAMAACEQHWQQADLPAEKHTAVVADCFDWLQQAARQKRRWNLVICDPPSFSPSEKTRESALRAYSSLAQKTCQLVEPEGLLALASCSSHITPSDFSRANLEGFGRSRRMARLVCERGLPPDHPTPLAMPELRYLKFQLFQIS